MTKYLPLLLVVPFVAITGCQTTEAPAPTPAEKQAMSANEIKRLTRVLLKASEAGDLAKVQEAVQHREQDLHGQDPQASHAQVRVQPCQPRGLWRRVQEEARVQDEDEEAQVPLLRRGEEGQGGVQEAAGRGHHAQVAIRIMIHEI